MSTDHKIIVIDGLKPCPLCGAGVHMEIFGKMHMTAQGEPIPIFRTRCLIKCPVDFLTLDIGFSGYVDAEGKTEKEKLSMLDAIMLDNAESVKETWNRRGEKS